MNFSERVLKFLYPLRCWLSPGKRSRLACDCTGEESNRFIRDVLRRETPCMIGRFGSTELAGMSCVRDLESTLPLLLKYWRILRGDMRCATRWNRRIRRHMADWSGFFPLTDEALVRFTRLMERESTQLDVLGSWVSEEVRFRDFFPRCGIVPIETILYPYRFEDPWTAELAGKRVLVIHPFEESIKRQFAKRDLLFPGKMFMPEFTLSTLKAVQSLRGECSRFGSWFDALAWMCRETDGIDFDIALIGCGAYGFPLAAYIKRSGRKAVHVGGALQLWFGIIGKRWQSADDLYPFINEHWIRPDNEETPRDLNALEGGGCYW